MKEGLGYVWRTMSRRRFDFITQDSLEGTERVLSLGQAGEPLHMAAGLIVDMFHVLKAASARSQFLVVSKSSFESFPPPPGGCQGC